MTDVKVTNQLTKKQLQTFLNIEHIRQHLIEVGLIDQYGEVISKEEYDRMHKSRTRRRDSSYKNIDNHRPLTAVSTRHPTKTNKNRQSKSPDYHSIHRRHKSISTSPSKHKNKSPSPTRLSAPNQSIRVKNISGHRSVSPKIIPNRDRCLVTMIYYGPQTIIDYERSWFEREGDEIIIMQQHCGGENLIVHKGALKAHERFQFESRRHADYPFALAFYVNGLIDHRLSICCESRYKHNVRIGGKRGLFGIINVQRSKACRRCRLEQRRKRIAELKMKNVPIRNEISTPEPNLTHSTTPDIPEDKLHSSMSISKENKIFTSEKNPDYQQRRVMVSPERDSDDEITTTINRSNIDSEEGFGEINPKKDIEE